MEAVDGDLALLLLMSAEVQASPPENRALSAVRAVVSVRRATVEKGCPIHFIQSATIRWCPCHDMDGTMLAQPVCGLC